MKFKFNGTLVEINAYGDVRCDDIVVKNVLTPVVLHGVSNPEDGHPAIIAITSIFGQDSVTDIDDDDSGMGY